MRGEGARNGGRGGAGRDRDFLGLRCVMGMADEGFGWASRGVVELEDWMVRFALIGRLRR